ncbi:MAG TPA: cofactor-independent phosphoglycerate mutase [Candidatus Prevotella stercoripullorum]|nr:cofactor-independent phosphoglycerate mutase [Candidatus Prevotella stercoripullorum]
MKHLIILGDGMADHPVGRLGGKTLLQYASKPYMDMLAREGRTGRLVTIPDGFHPGSEVANTAILGYDLNKVYEGRGPLEAASIGYDMLPDDMAMRCNIITLADGRIKNHHGGHLTTEQSDALIKLLNASLGNDGIRFITGIQYRNLLVIRNANKHIVCAPPHDHPDEPWLPLMVKPEPGWENKHDGARMTAQETADLINDLILKSQEILPHTDKGTLSIWPWGGGYRPNMKKLADIYPQIKSGAVISAVDLIRGIGHYAGLEIIKVEGATGLADTNYEGKAQAALDALRTHDFVYLHVEASDEAGHDGDLALKLKTIENLDARLVRPIIEEVKSWHDMPVSIALLPDHPTPVEVRTHVNEPVPFAIWHQGIEPDTVQAYDEMNCADGAYGMLKLGEFMQTFLCDGE